MINFYQEALVPVLVDNKELVILCIVLFVVIQIIKFFYHLVFKKKPARRKYVVTTEYERLLSEPTAKESELLPKLQNLSLHIFNSVIKDNRDLNTLKQILDLTKNPDSEKLASLLHPDIRKSHDRFLVGELLNSLIQASLSNNLGAIASQLQFLKIDSNVKSLLNDITKIVVNPKEFERSNPKDPNLNISQTNLKLLNDSPLSKNPLAQAINELIAKNTNNLPSQNQGLLSALLAPLQNLNPNHNHNRQFEQQHNSFNPFINRLIQESVNLLATAGNFVRNHMPHHSLIPFEHTLGNHHFSQRHHQAMEYMSSLMNSAFRNALLDTPKASGKHEFVTPTITPKHHHPTNQRLTTLETLTLINSLFENRTTPSLTNIGSTSLKHNSSKNQLNDPTILVATLDRSPETGRTEIKVVAIKAEVNYSRVIEEASRLSRETGDPMYRRFEEVLRIGSSLLKTAEPTLTSHKERLENTKEAPVEPPTIGRA